MRRFFACLPAALVLSAVGALPARADFSEDVRRMGDPYRASQAAGRQKVARAAIEAERAYDVRPSYRDDDDEGPRATQPQRPKAARPATTRKGVTRRATTARTAGKNTRRVRNVRQDSPRRVRVAALPGSSLHGVASYYYSGHTTASGARYNPDGLSAAHRTLPFGTRVRVRHLGTGRTVDVRINDRGPFIGGRVIDLSRGAARVIGMMGSGLARVSVEILGR